MPLWLMVTELRNTSQTFFSFLYFLFCFVLICILGILQYKTLDILILRVIFLILYVYVYCIVYTEIYLYIYVHSNEVKKNAK